MKYIQLLPALLAISIHQISVSQTETYSVQKTPFSSDFYDEFAPVFYRNGLVFCTNRNSGITDYSTSRNAKFIKIFYADTAGNRVRPKLFSKYLRTRLNDGPVTFNATGDTIYFSNNLITQGNLRRISAIRNKLGLFTAVKQGNKWIKIREMRFNNEWYNISTPFLSPDGNRLYFASDKPDGFGGSDLYYSERKGEYWSDPVNMGPVINTSGNESYPFINPGGELFFSSDGHPGLGRKDIFYSRMKDGKWLSPVRLDPPVNTQFDDFAFITDHDGTGGYFSSNRENSIDIYQFKTVLPQIFYADIQKENQYCFMFSDSGTIQIDTLYLKYAWDYGDGNKAAGPVTGHCYSGPGKYNATLDVFDKTTGALFFTKLLLDLDLRDIEQPYINSPDAVVTGESVDFDGLKSYLPGYDIVSYIWDFGDGMRMQGESVKHTFTTPGVFTVKMGLKLKSLSTGNIHNEGISKKVTVFSKQTERDSFLARKITGKTGFPDFRKNINLHVNTLYSAEIESKSDVIYRIELLSSKNRAGVNNDIFRNIPSKYIVKEEEDPVTGIWHYYIEDEQMSLMYVYPAWAEITGSGFKGAQVRMKVITDPVRKELINLLKNYGVASELYFDTYNRLRANAYLMLDQIVILMNRNPAVRLEIGVHTDNTGSAANNLRLSQTRAQVMVNYLVNRGIESKRLVAKGYGGTKPITRNLSNTEKQLNRRIELKLLN